MMELSFGEIAEAVNGRLIGGDANARVRGVSTDSREAIEKNDLFFPLIGKTHDAHRFIQDATLAGCVNFVVSREDAAPADGSANVILVADTTRALQDLARFCLRRLDLKKLAVTGSTGKTTTKEMLAHICGARYKTAKSPANMNNEIGLPLSILRMEKGAEALVLEMGMYRAGEIDLLADIVRPNVGVITNVGTAHIENFENGDGIRDAKLEISGYMGPRDTLIVNATGDGAAELVARAAGPYGLIKVGNTGKSDFILSGVKSDNEKGISFFLEHGEEMRRFFLPILGIHNATNAALAVAAASCVGISMEEAAKRLNKFNLSSKLTGKNGMKVIDDTYNANPDSMRAALDMLETVRGIRKVAVLGDMNELGERSVEYHRQIGAYAAKKGVNLIIAVGEKAAGIAEGAREAKPALDVLHFETKDDAWGEMKGILTAGDVILVKGSRGMAMETLVKRILE
ncbi:MAG: UDP-N-acetylmuramoyl-tripeptide--D-alanyl-D-alanine ligase [Clostridiales Family XIII bacterium]|jgi:UDP-N-acetylmuramoyl-tripeptide--D-alanyl-D-alanine ligase|nr:UDP-N-acetylmuramoyl-tripeptide--D-alanyl-D-alanine ligase [Clostridiales Family XIII bacterium]